MGGVTPLLYSLETSCPVPWSSAAECQLHQDYPFLGQDNTDENFVIRRYLETLWLPESLNPLQNLIADLRRVTPHDDADSSKPHPLHFLLGPLLLPTRAASDKYRTELVQILANGGGAGEQEEMMMWYTWNYEKVDPDVDEEEWKKGWLEKLEKRETMIQVLLNMLKLSLTGPQPQIDAAATKKRNKRSAPPESDEERLESYMDKISVWQLTASLDEISMGPGSSEGKAKSERHWTQIFCEDVVEALFKTELPEQCALLRSKVFPSSPFSDADDSDLDSTLDGQTNSRASSRARSVSRNMSSVAPTDTINSAHASTTLQRSRSRSLSVSLAADEASQRANYIEPKRRLSREVSMSRSFREKPKAAAAVTAQLLKSIAQDEKSGGKLQKVKLRDMGVTLVAETPVKRKRANSGSQDGPNKLPVPAPADPSRLGPSESALEDVHIGETPVLVRHTKYEHKKASASVPAAIPLFSDVEKPQTRQGKSKSRSNPRLFRSRSQFQPTTSFEDHTDKDDGSDNDNDKNNSKGDEGDDNDRWTDETTEDDTFTSSFGSPEVLRLSDSDSPQQQWSQPIAWPGSTDRGTATKPINGNWLKARSLSMHMDEAHVLEMETPTKKRIRRN